MSIRFRFSFFQRALILGCLAGLWLVFRETGTYSRTHDGCHVSTFGSGHDNFISIRANGFQNLHSIFTSLVDIGCYSYKLFRIMWIWIWTSVSFYRQNEHTTMEKTRSTMTGTCGRGGSLDTKRSSSTWKTLSSTRISSPTNATTQLLSTHDPRGIPNIYELLVCKNSNTSSSKAMIISCAIYNNFQPSVQPGVKLSKLIKEAIQLGCKTFSRSIDVVVARNWLKKVFDTLNDMKLDDDLKLRVATRLINKSATTW